MNTFINLFLLALGVSICLSAIIISREDTIDIQMHHSYFVIADPHIRLTIGIPILLLGLGYTILEYYGFPVNKQLKWTSLLIFILSLLVLYFSYRYFTASGILRRYHRFDTFETTTQQIAWWKVAKVLFIAGIFTFPLSFILSIINWIRAVIIRS